MRGTSATTGKPLSGIQHLRQSINDILTTPIGSRVIRRDYGSDLPTLVDAPMNLSTLTRIYAATARGHREVGAAFSDHKNLRIERRAWPDHFRPIRQLLARWPSRDNRRH
jgi:hypothetical protein